MNIFKRRLVVSTMLAAFWCTSMTLLPNRTFADTVLGDQYASSGKPSAIEVLADGLVVRPFTLAVASIGSSIFLLTAPFTLMSGNADLAAETLIDEPVNDLLYRCLGCLTEGRTWNKHPRSAAVAPPPSDKYALE